MITPTQAFILSAAGNSAMCLALPRKTLGDIYLNGSQIKENDEADAGWRFFGIAGAQACAGLYLADKFASGNDRKLLNGVVAAGALGNVGMFAAHKFTNDSVKPELRAFNLAMQAGVAGLAIKSLLEK